MANLWLEQGYRLHTSPLQLERARVLGRMYGQYNVRPGWWYAYDPYATVVAMAGLRGLGRYAPENCDPRDVECVKRNAINSVAQQQQDILDRIQQSYDQCVINAKLSSEPWRSQYLTRCEQIRTQSLAETMTVEQAKLDYQAKWDASMDYKELDSGVMYSGYVNHQGVVAAVQPSPQSSGAGATSGSGSYSPRVTLTTSTGNTSQLKPGDTWTLRIGGAPPNSYVYVTGGQNGATDTTQMGKSDGSGNWSANGSIDTSMIGNWAESWRVGGQDAGTVNFTVVAATQAQQSAATGKANASVPPGNPLTDLTGGDGTTGGGTGVGSGGLLGPLGENGMLYVLAAGAALFFMMGRR